MIVISRHVAIPDGELEITAIRAQGAGGQHVNKTSTAIHLRFDIRASSLPEYYKERLLAASHHLISSDGVIVIKAQEYRSQELNREAALARLVAMIKELTTEKSPTTHAAHPCIERAQAGIESTKIKREGDARQSAQRSGIKKEWMVKKAIVTAMAVISLFTLMGCNNRAEVDTLSPAQAAELKPMPQSWRGVLPCADCEGIETSLFLEKDGTWVMNERYLGAREEPSSFASYGTWARTADKLVLTDSKGEKSYYRAKGDALEMLDREGNPIESQFNYTLEAAQSSLPMTPMTLRGMYFYMADAATFTDCATGKRFMVANNAELERSYLAARGHSEKPVLLSVEGHFTLEGNPDTGAPTKVLAPDTAGKFYPNQDCSSLGQ